MHKYYIFAITICLLVMAGVSSVSADTILKPGDRMVFLGDSITQQMIYTRLVMDYVALHYPDYNVTFRNEGWNGDKAGGSLARLQRDVLDLKPTVVSIFLGMNDGDVKPFDQKLYDIYISGMTALVEQLKGAGIRVVLLTPSCVDPDRRADTIGYNDTLSRYAQGIMDLAKKERVPVFNIFTPMVDAQTAAKQDDPSFIMIPDGVHPGISGHAIIAYGLLQAMGCENGTSGLEVDAANKSFTARACIVKDLKVSGDSVSFVRTDDVLPMYYDPEIIKIFKYAPYLLQMNSYQFKVTGLKPGKWKLTVAGKDLGEFDASALAAGVDLSDNPGPWKELAKRIDELSKNQEDLYFARWRNIQLQWYPKEIEKDKAALLSKMDKLVEERQSAKTKLSRNRTWAWELTYIK